MVKGKLEDQIETLAFNQYIIFKPAMLLRKNTDRSGERLSTPILNFLNGLGLFRKFRPLPTSLLAEKMAKAPKTLSVGLHIIMLDKIREGLTDGYAIGQPARVSLPKSELRHGGPSIRLRSDLRQL